MADFVIYDQDFNEVWNSATAEPGANPEAFMAAHPSTSFRVKITNQGVKFTGELMAEADNEGSKA